MLRNLPHVNMGIYEQSRTYPIDMTAFILLYVQSCSASVYLGAVVKPGTQAESNRTILIVAHIRDVITGPYAPYES